MRSQSAVALGAGRGGDGPLEGTGKPTHAVYDARQAIYSLKCGPMQWAAYRRLVAIGYCVKMKREAHE